MVVVFSLGLDRQLSFESLVHHRAAIDDLIRSRLLLALSAYSVLYIVVVALSIPGASFLTVAGGIVFGGLLGGMATLVGATAGSLIVFLVAKSAFGESLLRRAGPLAAKLAGGFRADAFNYLLFLRLVPLFPFWLVNLVPALCGVRVAPFLAATALGIVPGTFAFAYFGAGLDSIIAAQESAYRLCQTSGQPGCRLDFDLRAAATPELMLALVGLGLVALAPIVVKRLRILRAPKA